MNSEALVSIAAMFGSCLTLEASPNLLDVVPFLTRSAHQTVTVKKTTKATPERKTYLRLGLSIAPFVIGGIWLEK